ncbi:pentatricopeptide repeat-containing protein At4g02750 [Selaginella moellendorffii]|uniref:pentatricopeptide repeat-containing protein At4g02750 n=1 Tax=Selaginella moellendorffii TaxID=88036 RepID=UPI000D1C2550|nr:pentatricopeptide repeat-containing protein At4g02750 [Selaginella moellendorffii]|eukprot:XP_024533665.1 pentatricopeptide repeat-containing protein At4g02750 [Selaginella moellendorffii]
MWSWIDTRQRPSWIFRIFSRGIKLSYVTDDYGQRLRGCRDLDEGKRLHSEIIKRGYGGDTFLGNLLVRMYGSFERLEEATLVFTSLQERNVFSWNILLHAFAQSGHMEGSKDAFQKMSLRSIVSWNDMLWALGEDCAAMQAKSVFDEMPERNVISWASLAAAFARAEKADEAALVCGQMPGWNAVACTTLVAALARAGKLDESRAVFEAMPERSSVSWNVFISACALSGHLERCTAVFERMPAWDVVSWNSLMQAYVENHCTEQAKAVFDAMPLHNLVTCNALIAAYGSHGMPDDAKLVFDRMRERDALSWVLVARATAAAGSLVVLEQLLGKIPSHSLVARNVALHAAARGGDLPGAASMFASQELCYHRDLFSWTTMVMALAEQQHSPKNLDLAREVFTRMACWDVTAWNAMLAGYSRAGDSPGTKLLFDEMPERDLVSWTSLLAVCSDDALNAAMHRVPARDVVLWNIVAGAYAQLGHIEQAKATFDAMDERDTVSWNTIVSAYAQAGHSRASLATFCAMDLEGVKLDDVSYVSLVEAVSGSSESSLSAMRGVHEIIAEVDDGRLLAQVTKVANAVLNMYAKRGMLQAAREVFDAMQAQARDVVTWSTLIAANGSACFTPAALEQTLDLFGTMQLQGIQADAITFVSLLAACSQAGHLVHAMALFAAVAARDFAGVAASLEHYVCLIDALARAGELSQAHELLECMPFEPNALAWQTLLGCAKDQLDLCRGQESFRHLVLLFPPGAPSLASAYTLLLQISFSCDAG